MGAIAKRKIGHSSNLEITTDDHERAFNELIRMKHRDLQRACIVRGLEPEELHKKSHPELTIWFYENFGKTQDETLLIAYDEYMEKILEDRGYAPGKSFRDPILRFSYVEPIIEGTVTKVIKMKEEKPAEGPRAHSTKHAEWDILTGTKKYEVYSLTIEKKIALDKIVEIVKDKHPDAEEKSIKIWYKRALKFVK